MIKILLTGYPGVGKTTVLSKIIERAGQKGKIVGGFICPEIRKDGRRIGFDIVDLIDGNRAPLARICSGETALRVGKYCVNSEDAGSVGVLALNKALEKADIIAIDEIGPMELKIIELRNSMFNALNSAKPLITVVHRRSIRYVKEKVKGNVSIYYVSVENRNYLPNIVWRKIEEFL